MFEMFSGLLGGIFGGLFRLAPELLKWLDKKDDRKHELAMFTLQTDLEKVRGTFRMEEKYVEHSTAQLAAIQEAFKEQAATAASSYKWVSAISALVRPTITYCIFWMYIAVEVSSAVYAYQTGMPWVDIVKFQWDAQDYAMLNMIISYWFLGRTIEKYQAR